MASPLVAPAVGFLSRLSYPKLFVAVATLFVIDLCIPNMIPFDDIALGVATFVLATWRKKPAPETAAKPPIEGQRSA